MADIAGDLSSNCTIIIKINKWIMEKTSFIYNNDLNFLWFYLVNNYKKLISEANP